MDWQQALTILRRYWSQEEIGEELGVSVRSVWGWEAGRVAPRHRHRRALVAWAHRDHGQEQGKVSETDE